MTVEMPSSTWNVRKRLDVPPKAIELAKVRVPVEAGVARMRAAVSLRKPLAPQVS